MTRAGMEIRTEEDHRAAVARIEELMSAVPDSPEGDELDELATVVDAYEGKHHAMDAPDPTAILRERMGLFPLQEVAVADEPVDDGTTTGIGWFATAEEAEEVAAALREAGIWYGVRDESSSEDFDPGYPFVLEVREMDLMKASAAIEESGVVAEVTDLEDE